MKAVIHGRGVTGPLGLPAVIPVVVAPTQGLETDIVVSMGGGWTQERPTYVLIFHPTQRHKVVMRIV